jgi:glycosyltransferase involved in cell wall biosynthesis
MSGEIAFVHSALRRGGAERLRYTVLKELAEQDVPCRVCLFKGDGDLVSAVRELGIPVDVLNVSGKLHSVKTTLRLASWLKKTRPSIVHGGQFLTNLHTTMASKIAGVGPVIIEEHGHNRWKRWHHRLLDRLVCSRADGVVCCSGSVKRVAQSSIRVPDDRFHVIHNCIDLAEIGGRADTRSSVRESLGVSDDEILFGTVGTLRPEKGHDVLIRAWRQFSEQHGDTRAKLVVVGDGPIRQKLHEVAKDLPGIIWAGSRSDVGEILAAMDVFVFPSIDEGLGIALIEAMATGLPSVVSDEGGIPEIVTDRETGLIVKAGDSKALCDGMAEVMRKPEMRQRLGVAACDQAINDHSPAVYCQNLLKLHVQLTSEGGTASVALMASEAATLVQQVSGCVE